MMAGLNQMVARQSKMAIKNHNTECRVKTHTYKSGSLHQTLKTSYRDTELQIQVLTSKISREERKPGWKKKGEEAGERGERGGLTDVSCHLQIPRRYGTFPWASREGRTGTQPYQKSDQTRTRIRVLCQEEVISLQSSAQAEGPSTRFLRPGPGD